MGHSMNYFELEKGFIWPDNSRFLSNNLGLHAKKRFAAALCVIAAISFIVSGISIFFGHAWQNIAIIVAVSVSTFLFIAFWDGRRSKLHTQGGVGILINILIVVYTFLL